MATYMKTL